MTLYPLLPGKCCLLLHESGICFQPADLEECKLEAYATIGTQLRSERRRLRKNQYDGPLELHALA